MTTDETSTLTSPENFYKNSHDALMAATYFFGQLARRQGINKKKASMSGGEGTNNLSNFMAVSTIILYISCALILCVISYLHMIFMYHDH